MRGWRSLLVAVPTGLTVTLLAGAATLFLASLHDTGYVRFNLSDSKAELERTAIHPGVRTFVVDAAPLSFIATQNCAGDLCFVDSGCDTESRALRARCHRRFAMLVRLKSLTEVP